jgi:PAS domain S-box-containing protein
MAMTIDLKRLSVSPLLRVLMLMDSEAESDALAHDLRRAGFELALRRATSEAAYLAELDSPLDLILADNALPEFDAMRALQILRTTELDIPLIVVTESSSEAAAIECVSLGAADFLFKDRPARLGSAVARALDQRELRAHARAAELALRESEERFRSAYEYAAIGIALVGLDGRWLQANRALCEFTGYAEQELLATTFQAITHPDDLAIDLANVRSLLAGEILSYQMEKRYLHKHGATIWALLSVSLVRDAQGQPRYFVSQLQDITERKHTDATRALLAAIVDSSDDAIIGIALDGTVMSWNSGAEHLYGYRADQMIGKPSAILRPPALQEEAAQLYHRLAHGEGTTNVETLRLRSDGQLIDVALTISALKDASGQISGFSTISRDISARKRGEQALRQKNTFIRLLQEVAVAANQATSLEEALQIAVNQICMHIGWPVGHVYMPDQHVPGALLPTHIWYLEDPQRFATFRTITEAVRLAPGVGLPGRALASRKSAWISDIILDVSTPRTILIQDIGVRAGFVLPVLVGDEVAAVLEFFATDAIEPDEALLDVLHHVGTQLGRVVERARAEVALRVSEERFRILFEHSPDAIILIDPHDSSVLWPIVECNDLACRMNGYTRDELIGQSINILNTEAGNWDMHAKYIERLRREGTLQFETIHRRKDGSLFSIEIVSSLISFGGRELVLGIDRDISARKRAEDSLRAAEAQYRTLVEQLPAIIYTAEIDKHSKTTYVSPQIEAILGFSPDQWISNPDLWLELVHPDDRNRILETVGRTHVSDEPVPIEFRSFTRDGRMVWLSDTARVVRDQTGQPLFLQGITLDITDRKQAEAALAEREAYFRALIEHSADAVALFGVDGSILYGSPATPRILGYQIQDFVGRNAFELIHPGDQAQIAEQLESIVRQPQATIVVQARIRHADGSWRDLEGILTNLLADPAVGAIVNNYRDITERKRAETALRESERQYRTLASNFPNGAVVLFDRDLRFTIADGAGLGAFGLTREEMEGRTIWEVYSTDLTLETEAYYRDALAGMPHVREIALGEHTYVVHTLPVRDERGQIIAGMLMSQDITERKRIEQALIEERALLARRVDERTADLSAANAELARAAMLKDEFLASMSHELRTPLNAVLGLSEALQEDIYGPLNDRQRQSLRSIEESGRHLLELINDILDLAKIGAGKLELALEPSSIETICQASLRMIKQIPHKKRLSVDLALDPAVTLLHVDARRLKQILVNLLSNAVKFTPEGGSIGLQVAGDAARQVVELTVWDTGIGIAQEQISELFQPFVQLDSRLARQYEGTGLGLALVYRMVEMHGGSVAVSSEVGCGSRFTVALPWPGASPQGPEVPAVDQPAIRRALMTEDLLATGVAGRTSQPPVVLLVEDNEANITMIFDYLGTHGYQVIVARNGAEAIARAIEARPAIVLMDIQMPGMDGLEATRCMRAMPELAGLPIIALTALAMPGDRERCLAAGANDYLSKPVSLRGLTTLIHKNLQQHPSQQRNHL